MNTVPAIPSGGLCRVIRRELGLMTAAPFHLLGMVVLPVVSTLIILSIFGGGVARDLPVTVVDADGSPLSGRLERMIDATPGLRVVARDTDVATARSRVLRGESYGTIVVPRDFARDVVRGSAPRVQVFYNAQYLLPGSVIRRDAMAAIATLSASVEGGTRVGLGQLPNRAAELVEPIVVDTHTLGNPALSYVPYLVTGILPTLLQIFIIVIAVQAFGSELKDRTAGVWLEAAGGRMWIAVVGKTLPYAAFFTAMSLAMLAILFGWLGIPLNGHPMVIAGATVLFVLAYMAMGFAAVALTGNLRLATSLAAFYSVPAFAFAGLTFPTFGMPALGQAWASLLPLTHYMKLVVDQALRGAPLSTATLPLQVLVAFATVPWIGLGLRMASLARDPRTWGRQ